MEDNFFSSVEYTLCNNLGKVKVSFKKQTGGKTERRIMAEYVSAVILKQ